MALLLRDNWIVLAIFVAVIAALVLLIWLWWQVPKWQMQGRIFKSEKERADVEDNFRKTVGQAIGGAAVLAGAFFAYLQFSQQQDTAATQFRQQQMASSEQFAKQQDAAAKDLSASRRHLTSNCLRSRKLQRTLSRLPTPL